MKELKLFTEGEVTVGIRQFTRLIGGFGEGKPVITTKQISELLGKQMFYVNEVINRNIEHFTREEGYIKDLKNSIVLNDTVYEILKPQGYSKQSISNSKNIYILSQSGFLLYLKFAEGDKAVELYKDFIEDYFKTKAENKVMKKTLEEEKDFLLERKKFILGSMFMEQDESKRMEFFKENETVSSRIKEIDVTLSKENLIQKVTP